MPRISKRAASMYGKKNASKRKVNVIIKQYNLQFIILYVKFFISFQSYIFITIFY